MDWILVLVVAVPGHCLRFTFSLYGELGYFIAFLSIFILPLEPFLSVDIKNLLLSHVNC